MQAGILTTGEEKIIKKYKVGIVLTLCISFLLTIYAPLELYFYNINDFWFNFFTMLPICLALFVTIWLIGSLVFVLLGKIHQKVYNVAVFMAFVGLICTYVQGTFMVTHLPPMDGTNIDWSTYSNEDLKTLLLWGVVLGLSLILVKVLKGERFYQLVEGSCLFLTAMLFVSIISSGIMTGGYRSKDLLVVTNKDEFEYSTDTNFIIFVLDAVDAGTVSDLMENDPDIQDVFEDFTYYENTMCVYPFTQFSMPFILSGEWYLNDDVPVNYFRKAFEESEFLQTIEPQYQMGIYSDSVSVVAEGNEDRFVNLVPDYGFISSYPMFTKGIIKMAGIRYAPFPFKRFCYNVLEQLNEAHGLDENVEEGDIFTCNNQKFYKELQDEEFSFTNDKQFKLIHLEGGHVPYRYNKDVEQVEDGTYQGNVEASITIASCYLDKLKENGVYDNSVIIIMADHGYSLEGLQGRQNPILFIKGIGEQHEMMVSEAPISYEDLQDAYQKLLGGASSDKVFTWKEGDSRQRRYVLYDYEEEEIMYEYTSAGRADETDQLVLTGEEYIR